jgi:hypothetical protein
MTCSSSVRRSHTTTTTGSGRRDKKLQYAVLAAEDQVKPELEFGLVVAPAQRGGGVVVGDLHEHR